MRATANFDLIPKGLRTEHLLLERDGVTISVKPVATSARCPACDGRSGRVHSRYARTISDLPWHGVPVTIRARVRRFFCHDPSCERAIFCERLPEVTAYARKTDRLEEALLLIAFELGGEAGARLARELGLLVSPDALLERLREGPIAALRE